MAVAVAAVIIVIVVMAVVVVVVVKALYFIREGEIQWYGGIVWHRSEIDKARRKLYDKIKGTNQGESVWHSTAESGA